MFAESVVVDALQKNDGIFGLFNVPSFDAVRCSRFAEYNFFIDKVKIGQLQCLKNDKVKVLMGYQASSTIPNGSYYMATNSEFFYSIGGAGTSPYLDGNAMGETSNFQ